MPLKLSQVSLTRVFSIIALAFASAIPLRGQASAELVRNGDFEAATNALPGWSPVLQGGGAGEIALDTYSPQSESNPRSMRWTVKTPGERSGVANDGSGSMIFQKDTWYDLTFHARTSESTTGAGIGLMVSLESRDGKKVSARATIPEVGGAAWRKYTLPLHSREAESNGRLIITMEESGTIWFDSVSLVPRNVLASVTQSTMGQVQDSATSPPQSVSPTNTASAQATTNVSGTNAPGRGRRGGGGGGRGGTNTLVFPPEETNRLVMLGNRNIGVHDPSTLIKHGDEYWIFFTGNGVPSWHSKDLTNWQRGPTAITNRPAWTSNVAGFRGGNYWAPDVAKVGDRYLLYYSASSFGRNTSGIGLATNPTLDPADPKYQWTDQGMVVMSRTNDDFNAIDPAITQDTSGGLWMSFGSFWSGIKMIQLDPKTGLRIATNSPMYSLAHYSSIEATFIYYHGGQYYQFVNWGFCCRGANSTYEIRVGRSEKITGPYLDKAGKDMLVSGGTKFMGTDGAMIGPGHAGILEENGKFLFGFHFYDGTTPRGTSKYAIRPLTWGTDGWPVVGTETPVK